MPDVPKPEREFRLRSAEKTAASSVAELLAWERDLGAREADFAAHVEAVERRLERLVDSQVSTLTDALAVVSAAFPQGLMIEAIRSRVLH